MRRVGDKVEISCGKLRSPPAGPPTSVAAPDPVGIPPTVVVVTDVDVFPYRLYVRLSDEEIYFANPDCRPARSLTKSENLQLGRSL